MRQYPFLGLVIFLSLLTCSCSLSTSYFYRTQVATDLTLESWPLEVNTSPFAFTNGADRYFFTGEPNRIQIANERAAYRAGISTLEVDVPNFTHVILNGSFQTELFGADFQNSVVVFGPNAETRQIAVDIIDNDTLMISQKDPGPPISRTIVRIGVSNLMYLEQRGMGLIEGRQLHSLGLKIRSSGCGNIYLNGPVPLQHVIQTGSGNITVTGAYTPFLDIRSFGAGAINLSGEMGVQWVQHNGSGDVNIIGANTSSLNIDACGRGKIGISGSYINLKQIKAKDDVHVYVYWVNSNNIYISAKNQARIGIAGYARTLYANLTDLSYLGARFLYAQDAYVRAYTLAHANFRASNKAFANAENDSSIYFFGSQVALSPYFEGNSTVVTIANHDEQPYRLTRRVETICPRVGPKWCKDPKPFGRKSSLHQKEAVVIQQSARQKPLLRNGALFKPQHMVWPRM